MTAVGLLAIAAGLALVLGLVWVRRRARMVADIRRRADDGERRGAAPVSVRLWSDRDV